MTTRIIFIGSNLLCISLIVTTSILTIIESHKLLYHLLFSVGGFVTMVVIFINTLLISFAQLLLQTVLSILYIVFGVLYIIHNHANSPLQIVALVTFIISIICITSSIILSFLVIQQTTSTSTDIELCDSDKSSSTSIVKKSIRLPSNQRASEQLKYFEKLQRTRQVEYPDTVAAIATIRNSVYSLGNQKESQQKYGHSYSLSTLLSEVKISRDPSSLLFDESLCHVQPQEISRSKSTNCIPNKTQIRRQRWKSITDEKLFLSNINESLLPPVLKTHSKQVSIDEKLQQLQYQEQQQEEEETEKQKLAQTQSVGDIRNLSDNPKEFKLRKSKSEYVTALNGLENIPEPRKPQPQQQPTATGEIWDMSHYNGARLQQGLNLNVSGISNLVSDENIKHTANQYSPANDDLLLPPKEPRLDDLDHLSDMSSAKTRIPSSRSASAPSLHTFRKLSQKLTEDLDSMSNESMTCPSTPPQIPTISVSKSPLKSPLKSLFRDTSPKKIFKHHGHHHKRTTSLWGANPALGARKSPRSPLGAGFVSHKYSTSEPNNNAWLALYGDSLNLSKSVAEPIDLWDVNTSISDDGGDDEEDGDQGLIDDGSVILGEYDHEKWRMIKELTAVDQMV